MFITMFSCFIRIKRCFNNTNEKYKTDLSRYHISAVKYYLGLDNI